jgi:hypothetical protein
MEIKAETYSIEYDSTTSTVVWEGDLYLNGSEGYAPISDLLTDVTKQDLSTLTLDLKQLHFLNSSGINVLSKFIIQIRQKENMKVLVLGSRAIPWQVKSLRNLQKLMPQLELDMA